jgi:hypothetical protein
MRYIANNYGMGKIMATATFDASSDAEARRIAAAKLPGKHGTVDQGRKGSIIGIRKAPLR